MSPTSTTTDWRLAADPDDLREYDAFGPWIDPVRTPLAMPPRFRDSWPELAGYGLVIKVPRNLDRAQARPGMDLYRSVLAVDTDRLCLLQLDGAGVRRRDVRLADVAATTVHTNLLVGVWTVHLTDGTSIEVEYNTVGHALMADVDRLVRNEPPGGALSASARPVPVADPHFRSLLAERRGTSDAPLVPIHLELPGQPCRDARNRRRASTGLMVLASPSELVVVNHGDPARSRFRWGNYASNVVSLRFDRLTLFAVTAPALEQPPRFHDLELRCGGFAVTQQCLVRPDAVSAVLAERGVPAA